MLARTPRVDVTFFAGALALGAALLGPQTTARADGNPPAPPPARAVAPRSADVKRTPPPPAPPTRARTAVARNLYGCNPGEDLACTVIHETADGVVVVTFRPTGTKDGRVWSVVNAPAESNAGSSGGTIYIVPGSARQLSEVQPAANTGANGAPIID